MKIRFSIRDILLTTTIVGLLCGWTISHRAMQHDYTILNAKYLANTKQLTNIISLDQQYEKNLGTAINDCINAYKTIQSYANADELQSIMQEIQARRILARLYACQSVNNRRPSELNDVVVQ